MQTKIFNEKKNNFGNLFDHKSSYTNVLQALQTCNSFLFSFFLGGGGNFGLPGFIVPNLDPLTQLDPNRIRNTAHTD
jgi:hypothetical protein